MCMSTVIQYTPYYSIFQVPDKYICKFLAVSGNLNFRWETDILNIRKTAGRMGKTAKVMAEGEAAYENGGDRKSGF